MKTTCNENVKFEIIKIRTSCQYVGYFHCSKNLKWATQNLGLCRGSDIAALGVTAQTSIKCGLCKVDPGAN